MSKKAGVGTIKGVGEKTEKLFEKIGVYTVDDLIHYYPRGYEIFGEPVPISEVEEGKVCTICGSVFGRVQDEYQWHGCGYGGDIPRRAYGLGIRQED